MGSAPSTRQELIGETIDGKYRVRSVIGMGGMGTVLAAEHIAIGRPVAIKVLHLSQLHKERAVRRFHREARAAGTIGHPNICEAYDVGDLPDGSPYLVMERLVGETLGARLAAEGQLEVDLAVELFSQVLEGLVAAHRKGIVHRDVKPENVFITHPVGHADIVKVLDFGISMLPISASEESSGGLVMGTPHYMAPEQAGGERDLDGRVDVYSCGVMLYQALTGRLPFTGRNFSALLAQVLTTRPPPLRELRPDLPAELESILGKALARDRDDRYRDAATFLGDLRAVRPLLASPAPGSIPDSAPTERDLGAYLDSGEGDEAESHLGEVRPEPVVRK